jgi:hypothetical protein
MTDKKRMILFTNRNTDRSIYLLLRDGNTHVLDTDESPSDGREAIEFMMNLNHVVIRAAQGSKALVKATEDMEKLIAG